MTTTAEQVAAREAFYARIRDAEQPSEPSPNGHQPVPPPPEDEPDQPTAPPTSKSLADRLTRGGTFILDQPEGTPAVWGEGTAVAWSKGEPLLVVGPPGVGKTTIMQQVALRRAGVLSGPLLGLPIEPSEGRVLYIAADRPRQAARSFRRMVDESHRDQLDRKLVVWRGPLPFHLPTAPERLAAMAEFYGADCVVIDSLKDVAPGLEKPEIGSAVNVAFQHLVANDVEVAGLHHQRKASGDNKRPTSLADVYGSTWLTAGAGSVILVWGDAGDPVVELSHLKQPADQLGPMQLTHDHDAGTTTTAERPDPLAILRRATKGLTARTLAQSMTGRMEVGAAEVERARRKLERLTGSGFAIRQDGGPTSPTMYLPAGDLQAPS